MLKHLVIKNYALIKNLSLYPTDGLNIITGETGAGKSIMLGAVGLIMGNRADVKALFDENEKCIVEGTFAIERLKLKSFFENNDLDYDDNCVIRREIAPNGKSRAFINDTPVTLESLKFLGQNLIDVHSQNETLALGNNNFQISLLDSFAQNSEILESYKAEFQKFKLAENEFVELQKNALELKKEFDYNSFLLDELNTIQLNEINQEELEEELTILEHAEEVKKRLAYAFQILNNPEASAISLLKDANVSLSAISNYAESYKNLKERMNSSIIEIQDISDEIEAIEDKVETNDAQVLLIKDKLNLLYKIQTKHGVKSIAELLTIRDDLQEKVDKVLNFEDALIKLEKSKIDAQVRAEKLASKLSEIRLKFIPNLSKKVQTLLIDLGMPDAVIQIKQKPKSLSADGIDDINFEFSANKGSLPKSLKDVASGGEFSRLMLAFKYILAEKNELPTIIFDEIDTGISGEVAIKVGKMMAVMAQKLQVISITHLHQIAGKGKTHFYVYKDNSQAKTVSLMKKLEGDERIVEVAKMIGGQNPSESAIKSAIEILEIA